MPQKHVKTAFFTEWVLNVRTSELGGLPTGSVLLCVIMEDAELKGVSRFWRGGGPHVQMKAGQPHMVPLCVCCEIQQRLLCQTDRRKRSQDKTMKAGRLFGWTDWETSATWFWTGGLSPPPTWRHQSPLSCPPLWPPRCKTLPLPLLRTTKLHRLSGPGWFYPHLWKKKTQHTQQIRQVHSYVLITTTIPTESQRFNELITRI